jgi:outer membrane protein
MKNASLILNIVLLLAIIPLYYFQFAGNKPVVSDDSGRVVTENGGARIAYIDTDSLFQNYQYYDDISKDYRVKRERAQKQLENRTRALEEKFVSLQRRAQAGLMSQNEIRRSEEELVKEQQDLQVYQQTVSAGLIEEEQLLNKQLFDKITAYLEGYNKDKGYDMIMNYTKGNAIWLADEALDITQEVLSGLNTAYAAEKASAPADATKK